MEAPDLYPAGSRVQIVGNWEWPDGTTGTITLFPGVARAIASDPPGSPDEFFAAGLARRNKVRKRDIITQWVQFDEPTDDGSGHGPYYGGEVDVQNLVPLARSSASE
jgi:hypothetical protein